MLSGLKASRLSRPYMALWPWPSPAPCVLTERIKMAERLSCRTQAEPLSVVRRRTCFGGEHEAVVHWTPPVLAVCPAHCVRWSIVCNLCLVLATISHVVGNTIPEWINTGAHSWSST